ncbi:TetR/AcrR family transcriptional regulator [Mycobacterium sp. AMU20-3851]|uniref:TetR/AcrR family transcriptional regulator n=1 Tax=Mycobacterium sp. AMU20-3851 TaxID=3122055 RepID=UPI0037546924
MLRQPMHRSPTRSALPPGIAAAGNLPTIPPSIVAVVETRPVTAARIMATTMRMSHVAYDSFQVREVAHAAQVSPGTLYRHFTSKNSLLVACLEFWLTELEPVVRAELIGITDPIRRMRHVSKRIALGLGDHPLFEGAFVRAYLLTNTMYADSDVVRERLNSLFAQAICDGQVDKSDVSELITDIWTVNMPALVQRRLSLDELHDRLEYSVVTIGLARS